MSEQFQGIRGMNDTLPDMMSAWHVLEDAVARLMRQYGYSEIRLPVLEKTNVFKRAIGDVTDIVEKEMYTFEDRNGDSLTLRPEGTAQCVRACIEHALLRHETPRLWYTGPMFRHERPQKGRYRQFYQIGAEVFGVEGPEVDAELIAMTHRLWQNLGLDQSIHLQLNSLGTPASRAAYRDVLVEYFTAHKATLDEDSLRRLQTNPLRILDSKNPDMAEMLSAAPALLDHLDEDSKTHFETLCHYLTKMNIPYQINTRLVRGLDYYTKTVFEWVTDELGAQGTVCGGGRYDGLVKLMGAREDVPAIGFSAGMERLILMIQAHHNPPVAAPDAFMIVMGEHAKEMGLLLAEKCRSQDPLFSLSVYLGGGSLKSQMKKADKSGAKYAFILGDDEAASGQVGVKHLREDKPQATVAIDELMSYISDKE